MKSHNRTVAKTSDDAKTTMVAKRECTKLFARWWTMEELSEILSKINPGIIAMFMNHGEKLSTPERLAEILYDSVGDHFLRNIENSPVKRRLFLELILYTVIEKNIIPEEQILDAAREAMPAKESAINEISDVIALEMTNRLCQGIAKSLGLPLTTAEKEHVEKLPETEVVEPYVPLNPLYDYQYSTGFLIRTMLEGSQMDENGRETKRQLIAVPTGSGKTRMIVETLVEWLNDGKPSKNVQQHDSKFILWIAQSHELCEQALSTFRSVFEAKGRRGTTLRLHRFWGTGGSLPDIAVDDLLGEKGIIIATIQSLAKLLDEPRQLESLAALTSCIIMDEAHHTVAESYAAVLRRMGFNWSNRKKEISERGIILVGLTATPFRGKGENTETERLQRWYGGIHFPTIPHSEDAKSFRPHALIDCQTFGYAENPVRILGESSYDRDGFIPLDGFTWSISRGSTKPDIIKSQRNITYKFPKPGTYKIRLDITDNEGDTDSAEAKIEIVTMQDDAEDPSTKQKTLYQKLILRDILCDVYHKTLDSESIQLDAQDIKHLEQFGEFRRETLKSLGNNYSRNKMIIDEIYDLHGGGKKRILFFGCSVAHSRQIAMLLKTLYGLKSRYVDSKMDLDSRASAIEEFRAGSVDVLCNFDVLTTGFDAPAIDCVFVGRPVKSTLLYTQMIGRGMRGPKSGGTKEMLIVDIDDNFDMIGTASDPSVAHLGWKTFQGYWKQLGAETKG